MNTLTKDITCFSTTDCQGIFPFQDIVQTEYGEKIISDYYLNLSKSKIIDYINESNHSKDDLLTRIHFLRSDGSFRAYQCPRCNFGPLMHGECSDLLNHHLQELENGVTYNNACPNCKTLYHDVKELSVWNGA